MVYLLYITFMLFIILRLFIKSNSNINIYIANSFKGFYNLPINPISCFYNKKKYKCIFSNKSGIFYHASIYNGNIKFPAIPDYKYNIVMTTEKLSQVMFMKSIGDGKNKYYRLAVDYRSFNNRWHLSIPRFSNTSHFIYISRRNFVDIEKFMKRNNNIVYIQRACYKNREYLVKQIIKTYNIDSYGNDLNNKKWPINISRNNKIELLKKYKFCLAIENSVVTWKIGNIYQADEINNDYITEKLIDCFLAGSIPIYFGPKNINDFLPHTNALINMNRYSSINNLTDYLHKIKNNITLIKKYFQWHYNYSNKWFKRFSNIFNYCNICNYVNSYS